MQAFQYIWHYVDQNRGRLVVRGLGVVLALLILGATLSVKGTGTFAKGSASCTGAGINYTVAGGDTLSSIATRFGTTWSALASHNRIVNPNLLSVGQSICVSGQASVSYAQPVNSAFQAVSNDASGVQGIINQVFGPYSGAATRVAQCESSLNPNATNSLSVGGSYAKGLFQVLYPSTWMTTSQAANSPYDAYANTVAAHEIFVRDGYSWREWVCQP